MPIPTADDPLRCPGSDRTDYERREGRWETWWICGTCTRVLKRVAGAHRVRSRTTQSLDKTRDILADVTREEIERGEEFARNLTARSPA